RSGFRRRVDAAGALRRHRHRRLPADARQRRSLGTVQQRTPHGRRQPARLQQDDAAAAGGDVRPRHLGDLEPIPMRPRLVLAVALAAQLACGGSSSPTSPAPALSLAGTWTGSWQFVTSGVTVSDAVTATFT